MFSLLGSIPAFSFLLITTRNPSFPTFGYSPAALGTSPAEFFFLEDILRVGSGCEGSAAEEELVKFTACAGDVSVNEERDGVSRVLLSAISA